MAPKTSRLKKGPQSAATRAWDRSFSRFKEFGNKLLKAPDSNLSLTELQAAVDDLSILIQRAAMDGQAQALGVWGAFIKSGDAACLVALHSVVVRRSCPTLAPGVSGSLRPLYATLRSKLTAEFAYAIDDLGPHPCKGTLCVIASALLGSDILRCYAALLSDAMRPMMSHFRIVEYASPPNQAVRISLARRVVQSLADVLGESKDVLSLLHQANDLCAGVEQRWEDVGVQLGSEVLYSGFLELWCRGLLLLASCEGCERQAATLIEGFFPCVHGLKDSLNDLAHLTKATPSFNLLISAHMVRLCAALDGGGVYGLPAAAAPWSAPLLAALLPGAGAGAGAAGTSRPRHVRQLDFSGDTASTLYMASMAMWAWTLSLLLQETALNLSRRTALLEAIAVASRTAGLEASVASEPVSEPRTLQRACMAYRDRLEKEYSIAELALSIVVEDVGCLPADMQSTMTAAAFKGQVEEVCTETTLAIKLVECLAAGMHAPPLNAVGVLDVCLRQTASAWEALLGTRHPSRQQQAWQCDAPTLRLSRAASVRFINDALTTARSACRFIAALAARTQIPRRALLQMEACWRECLAWAALKAGSRGSEAQRALEGWKWESVTRTLALEGPSIEYKEMPLSAPPGVAAAIAAGYIPALKYLIRFLVLQDKRQCADFLHKVISPDNRSPAWELLLAFSPLNQAASLLATIANAAQSVADDLPGSQDEAIAVVAAAKAKAAADAGLGSVPLWPKLEKALLASWPLRKNAVAMMPCSSFVLLCTRQGGLKRLRWEGEAAKKPAEKEATAASAAVVAACAPPSPSEAVPVEAPTGVAEGATAAATMAPPSPHGPNAMDESATKEAAAGSAEDGGYAGPGTVRGCATSNEGGVSEPVPAAAAAGAQCVGRSGHDSGSGISGAAKSEEDLVACTAATAQNVRDLNMSMVVSYVACHVLPAYVALFRRVALLAGCDETFGLEPTVLGSCPILPWIPVLAARAHLSELMDASAKTVAGGAVSSGDGPPGDPAQPQRTWMGVLLRDLDVFGLLSDLLFGLYAGGVPAASTSDSDPLPEVDNPVAGLQDAMMGLAVFLPLQTAAALREPHASAADPRVGEGEGDPTAAPATPRRSKRILQGAPAAAGAAADRGKPAAGSRGARGAVRHHLSLWEGLNWAFGPDGPHPNSQLVKFLGFLRVSGGKLAEYGIQQERERKGKEEAAQDCEFSVAELAIDAAAVPSSRQSMSQLTGKVHEWLLAAEHFGVLMSEPVLVWLESASLLLKTPMDAL